MKHNTLAITLFESQIIDESIYSFQELLENRLDFIKTKYKNTMDGLIDTIANQVDPSKNKKYTDWLVQRHMKEGDVFDPKVKESLGLFDKASSNAHDTNINNHTLESLHDVAHIIKTGNTEKNSVLPLEQIYNQDGVTGFKIPNKATSVAIYGPGKKFSANWCTSTPTQNNMFDRYDGGKYTMHFPSGDFLQINHSSSQAKDPSNTEIEFDSDKRYLPYKDHIERFMRQTADLDGVSHKSLPNKHFGVPDNEFQESWNRIKNGDSGSMDIFINGVNKKKLTDDQFEFAKKQLTNNLTGNTNLTEDQMTDLIKSFGANTPPNTLYNNPSLTDTHKSMLISKAMITGYTSRLKSVREFKPKHIDSILNIAENYDHPNQSDAVSAIQHIADRGNYEFNEDQIDRLGEVDPDVVKILPAKQKVSEHRQDNFIDHIVRRIKRGSTTQDLDHLSGFAEHNGIKSHHLHRILDAIQSNYRSDYEISSDLYSILDLGKHLDDSHLDRIKTHVLTGTPQDTHFLVGHPKLPDSIADHIISKIDFNSPVPYLKRRNAKAALVHESYKRRNIDVDSSKLESAGFFAKKDVPDEYLNDEKNAMYIMKNLEVHHKMKAHHLDKMISGIINEPGHIPLSTDVQRIIDHPNITTRHIEKLVDAYKSDRYLRTAIAEHPRTPPRIVKKLDEYKGKMPWL